MHKKMQKQKNFINLRRNKTIKNMRLTKNKGI